MATAFSGAGRGAAAVGARVVARRRGTVAGRDGIRPRGDRHPAPTALLPRRGKSFTCCSSRPSRRLIELSVVVTGPTCRSRSGEAARAGGRGEVGTTPWHGCRVGNGRRGAGGVHVEAGADGAVSGARGADVDAGAEGPAGGRADIDPGAEDPPLGAFVSTVTPVPRIPPVLVVPTTVLIVSRDERITCAWTGSRAVAKVRPSTGGRSRPAGARRPSGRMAESLDTHDQFPSTSGDCLREWPRLRGAARQITRYNLRENY